MPKKANRAAMYGGKPMFPKRYLSAEDLPGDMVLQIRDVKPETMEVEGGEEVSTYTMGFDGWPVGWEYPNKRLCLGSTKNDQIIQATGETEAKNWAGHWITIYPTTCRAFGDPKKPCVRIRTTAPKPPQNAPESTQAKKDITPSPDADKLAQLGRATMRAIQDADDPVGYDKAVYDFESGLAELNVNPDTGQRALKKVKQAVADRIAALEGEITPTPFG